MITTMEQSKDNEVVAFPIQKKEWGTPMTDAELIQNFRLSAIRLLNAKAAGKYEFTLEDIKGIMTVNDICLECGYPPIITDISQLS